MRKILLILLCMGLSGAVPALAGGLNFDLNVHLGDPGGAPVNVSPPPLFLESATLGLQVSVGTADAMFHLDGRYFLFRNRRWLVAPRYDGPWTVIRHDRLPPGLAKRNYREILALRHQEYDRYRHGNYHGRTFRPGRARHGWRKEHEYEHEHGHGHGRHGWK
jgi:hypothetical protein